MENLNLPPFYVGQRVVYLTGNHMVKGSIHPVKAIVQMSCGCWLIDVGVSVDNANGYRCSKDGGIFMKQNTESSFFDATSFAPIEEQFRSITFEEVISIESPLIGIN